MVDVHEKNKDVVVRLMDAFSAADHALLDALMSDDYIQHNPTPNGREPVKRMADILKNAFPDGRMVINDIIAEGDKVVARISMTGTHSGPLIGIAPTGKYVEMTSIDIWRIENGICVEHWDEVDRVGLLRQIGLKAILRTLLKSSGRRQILSFAREQGIMVRRPKLGSVR
ncbi:ester cyclase [Nocardia sp. NPDC047648]|uniref:ester cyclase n=1 Tax=Nocardia sp. NPDC047648 TaxID=3155625 RepID=UPI0033F67CF8